ncbi:hypothetical protein TSOC_005167 [Tetrabaena socialis]|uniref:Transmembrane protein 45B n=1 Tax=Tetrabaena socialis TaxID=47790 RepID=A0A2J8A6X0_9CHLO|nr:hypothetical protein TSOC_005167 [Tetrabaena socialis]|eukprot:PNH08286.1 hypothetical protein TSOC_005167 [Tetrabaena socialis]
MENDKVDLMHMDVLRCDGKNAESVRKIGTVFGHFVPFITLTIWALHAFVGACWRYCLAQRDPSAPPYTSHTWEPLLPFLPSPRWRRINQRFPMDPIFKAVAGTLILLYGYRFPQIVCPDGVREGRIVGQHVMYWAHAMLLLASVSVGLVELAMLRVRFPAGTSAAVMVAGYIVLVVIFSYHQKHEIFDQTTHQLVGHCYLVAMVFGVMELFQPTSILAFSGKIFFHIMGSAWLGMAGYMLFSGSVFWSPVWNGQTDVGPVMFAPIVFTMMMLGLMAFMLVVFALIDLLAARRLRAVGPDAPAEAMLALTQLSSSQAAGEEWQGLRVKGEASGGYSAVNGRVDGDAFSSGLGSSGAERKVGLLNGRA